MYIYKRWIQQSFLIILLLFTSNCMFLYYLDTYAIAKPHNKYYSVPNQRFLIVEYLKENAHKYNTYIFGSSRVGYINPLHLNYKHTYNLSVGAGIPHEHLLMLQYLIKNKIHIENILIALDDFSFTVPYDVHKNSLNLRSHYLITQESKLDFYKSYFIRSINNQDIKQFKRKLLSQKVPIEIHNIKQAIFNQEKFYKNQKIENLNTVTAAILKQKTSQKKYLPKALSHFIGQDNIKQTLQDIKQIIKLCKHYKISYKIILNPMSKTLAHSINQNLYIKFKTKLAYITDYYDFSQPNPINNNQIYWIEPSHYKLYVGDLILQRIYENNTSIPNFGVYIKNKK